MYIAKIVNKQRK